MGKRITNKPSGAAKPRRKDIKMKKYESDYYNVRGIKDEYGLCVHHNDTLENVREEIDRVNQRAVERGYNAEQWVITHVEVYTWKDDNGVFVKREEIETRVEIYPAIII